MASVCPFSAFLFVSSAAYFTYNRRKKISAMSEQSTQTTTPTTPVFQVVFVLGGPGAGKGTQCSMLTTNHPNWTHLSAGDLLRAERKSKSSLADLINDKISKGQIVPASITVNLLKNAMDQAYSKNNAHTKFLIDGFPRSEDNVSVWNEVMEGVTKLEFVLFMDCPEDVMTGRLLERGKTSGRNDDNLETIRKRFVTFREESMPIVKMYEGADGDSGIVKHMRADRSPEDIYQEVEALFIAL